MYIVVFFNQHIFHLRNVRVDVLHSTLSECSAEMWVLLTISQYSADSILGTVSGHNTSPWCWKGHLPLCTVKDGPFHQGDDVLNQHIDNNYVSWK